MATTARDHMNAIEPDSEPRTKKEKKVAAIQHEERIKAELNIFLLNLGPGTLRAMTFYSDFESLCLPGAALVLNSIATLLIFNSTGFSSPLVHLFTVAVLLLAAFIPAKVEVTSEVSEGSSMLVGKATFFIVGAIGTIVAGGVLWGGSAASHPVLSFPLTHPEFGLLVDFGYDAARSSIDELTRWIKTKLDPSGKSLEAPFFSSDGTLLVLGLSLLAGFMAAALYSCGAQYSRSLHFMLITPPWGAQHIVVKKAHLWLARVGLALPIIVVGLQFRPVADFWGIPIERLPMAQAACLSLIALAQALALPGLCQSWLNSGLIDWYLNSHSGMEHPRKSEILRGRLDFIRAKLVKVAIQLVSFAIMALSTAVLCGFTGKHGLMPRSKADSVFSFCGQFFAWFGCLAWSASALSGLTVKRLGLDI